MGVLDQLKTDLNDSLKAGDTSRLGVVRLLRGALKNEEIKQGHQLSEDEALKVLAREAKQRRDSIAAYQAAARDDLVKVEEAELAVIAGYLPQALSEAEVKQLVDQAVGRLGASSPQQMGAVIGAVMKEAGARSDGGLVSRLVRERLSGAAS